ncbi:MAG: cell wall hydrolase [Clostridiales bacterium]|nr:cell wall hydrolase [Clostridiales bacterium]
MVIFMTVINTFLQKKRLREFGHGIYMVFAAYVLSFLLLIIGSDTFYNIKSKADVLNTQSHEVNQIRLANEDRGLIGTYDKTNTMTNSYQVEYRMDYMQKYLQNNQESVPASDDTNWLLGYSMNDDEYLSLMHSINESEVFLDNDKKAIKSFSTSALSASDLSDDLSKESISKTASTADKSSKVHVVTKEEVKMLEQIVEAEATGEDIIGKILVANVIFNRMADDEFPDKVKEVIFQKVGDDYQFSPISDKRYWSVKVTAETKEAVQRAINGEDHSEGALYFMARRIARKSSAKWFDNNLQWLFKHGEHEFFK